MWWNENNYNYYHCVEGGKANVMEVLKKWSHYPMFDGKYMWLVVMRLNLPGLQSLSMTHGLGWQGYLKVVCCIGQQIIIIIAGMYCIGQRKFVSLQQLVDHYQVYFQIQSSNQHLFLLVYFYPWMLKRMISSTSFFQRAPIYTSQKGEKLFLIKPLAKWAASISQVIVLTSNHF